MTHFHNEADQHPLKICLMKDLVKEDLIKKADFDLPSGPGLRYDLVGVKFFR